MKYSGSEIIEDKLVKWTKLSVNDRNQSTMGLFGMFCFVLFIQFEDRMMEHWLF